MKNGVNDGWKRGDPVRYVRDEIPDFDVPPYRGERYEVEVPDTLDLQDRAALAINGLTGPTDPEADYEIYWSALFKRNPPMMQHDLGDHCQVKFMEALPLMRIISGSDQNEHVDRRWMEVALHRVGPDGQVYMPIKGRPWILLEGGSYLPDDVATDMEHFFDPVYAGRLLSVMTLYHLRDGGSLWTDTAKRVADGLADLAVDRGSYAYFSPTPIMAFPGHTEDHWRTRLPMRTQAVSRIQLGLMHLYRETGHEPALDLAKKLINYSVEEIKYWDDDGTFTADYPDLQPTAAHFHQHVYGLQCLAEYTLLTGDDRYRELIHNGYAYGKAHGNTVLGYFPEWVRTDRSEASEMCEVGDMIALALEMTELGMGDYWDDVDRWIRNVFAECQLSAAQADYMAQRVAELPVSTYDPAFQTVDRVLERNVGAFAGWPHPNDWGEAIQHCCTGNSSRAIYYVWERIVQHDEGRLKVNLLLNRASPWADVDSHIPYVGRVDVRIKKPVHLAVRIPDWVSSKDVRVRVDGDDRRHDWNGRYVLVGDVVPGNVATITFPIAEHTETLLVEKREYTVVKKGNEVVAMEPAGPFCPLYQREHYREDTTRWKKTRRFVSNETVRW
ncbi:MAG: glycoside hydrolase family 127 protein [Lentisphaerae bacterium]|nr:glycoside hydrolase family 127 protein [Lentisphaerota bacterium]